MIEVYLAQTDPCPPDFPDVLECFADRDVADRFASAANVGLTDSPDDQEERVVVVPMKVNTTTTVPAVQVSWHGVFVLDAPAGAIRPAQTGVEDDHAFVRWVDVRDVPLPDFGAYLLTGDLASPYYRPDRLFPQRELKHGDQALGEALPAVCTAVTRWRDAGWTVSIDGSDRDAVLARMRSVAEQLRARAIPVPTA